MAPTANLVSEPLLCVSHARPAITGQPNGFALCPGLMRVNTRRISLHNGLPAAEGPLWKHVALAYVARGISVPIHCHSMVGALYCGAFIGCLITSAAIFQHNRSTAIELWYGSTMRTMETPDKQDDTNFRC